MPLFDRRTIRRVPFIEPRSWQLTVLRAALIDEIGIGEMVILAREERPEATRREILDSLKDLLDAGLLQVGLPAAGGGLDVLPGSNEEVAREIDREWRELGRDPSLGDIGLLSLKRRGIDLAEAWPLLRFIGEPRGSVYHKLLDWLADRAAEFYLVVRDESQAVSASVKQALNSLGFWRIALTRVGSWPGTMLPAGTATLVRHRCRPSPADALFRLAASPFDWQHPVLPEDLSFVDAYGKPLLINVAHERHLSLDLAPDEFDDLARRAPDIVDLLDGWPPDVFDRRRR